VPQGFLLNTYNGHLYLMVYIIILLLLQKSLYIASDLSVVVPAVMADALLGTVHNNILYNIMCYIIIILYNTYIYVYVYFILVLDIVYRAGTGFAGTRFSGIL